MKRETITAVLSANAGVCVTTPSARYWVDALHDQQEETFSVVTPEMWERMKAHPDCKDPDVIIFTHLHGDHFSRPLLEEAMRLYPSAKVILPSAKEPFREFSVGEDKLYSIRTLHEGRAFTDVLHEAVVLESGGRRILLTGDMRVERGVAEKLAKDFEENTGIPANGGGAGLFSAVFAAFPWETTTKGRRIMEQVLTPEQVILYHIPFEKDDAFGYREGVRKIVGSSGGTVLALKEPFAELEWTGLRDGGSGLGCGGFREVPGR